MRASGESVAARNREMERRMKRSPKTDDDTGPIRRVGVTPPCSTKAMLISTKGAEKSGPDLHRDPGRRPCAKDDRCNANREHTSHQYASGVARALIGESR